MKKLITTLILLVTLGLISFYYQDITKFIMYNFIYKSDLNYDEANEFKREYDWGFVQKTDDFEPNNRQDILNIIYTMLNNGWDDFTFFCPSEYEECIDEVQDIINNSTLVSNINNFVSPYNSYNKISVNINSFGRINILVDKLYSNELVNELKLKVDEVYNNLINNKMNDEEKIRAIHNYIIDSTSYDEERSNEIKNSDITTLKHSSNIAYGPLFTGKAICGGYADAMALFLDKMEIKNFKIASTSHIWNFVYINNEWKHLDLTWDDPVVATGENVITDTFFLITTNELREKETTQHIFDEKVFIEAK